MDVYVHVSAIFLFHRRIWKRCREGCSSGSSLPVDQEPTFFPGIVGGVRGSGGAGGHGAQPGTDHHHQHGDESADALAGGSMGRGGSLQGFGQQRHSQSSQAGATAASLLALNKPPAAFASLAGLLAQNQQGSEGSPNLSLRSVPPSRPSPKQPEVKRAKVI